MKYCDRQGCLDTGHPWERTLPDGCEVLACHRHQMFPEDAHALGAYFHQHLVPEGE